MLEQDQRAKSRAKAEFNLSHINDGNVVDVESVKKETPLSEEESYMVSLVLRAIGISIDPHYLAAILTVRDMVREKAGDITMNEIVEIIRSLGYHEQNKS